MKKNLMKMERFNVTKRGYKYDKIIFWVVMLVTIGLVLYNFAYYNFDFTPRVHFVCSAVECPNPYFLQDCKQQLTILFVIPIYTTKDCSTLEGYEWIKEEKLPYGEYGDPEPDNFFYRNVPIIVFVCFLLAFLLNHFFHNRGRKFDIEIRISKKTRLNYDWLDKTLKEVNKNEKH